MGDFDAEIDTDPINLKVDETETDSAVFAEYLNKSQLEEIHRVFENGPRNGFKKAELKSKVFSKFKIEFSDEEYETLFTKLDRDKNDTVTWDNMVTYLAFELQCKGTDSSKSVSIENPIVDEPEIIHSGHRSSIIHIMFSPSVRLNGTIDYDDGKYMSMSKDGCVNLWSLDLKLLRSYRDKSLYSTVRGTWVTNFVCLPDLNVFVTSSTERELRFYDTTSKRFKLVLVFVSMPFCVNHMFYHFHENVKEESILVCGDLGGNVRVMQFPKEDKGPFKQKIGVDTLVLKWDQVVKGKLNLMKAYNILNVHTDWVRQVSYYKLLGSIVSCSTSPNAMFMGDFHGSKTNYVFVLKRGIETFCLCEDTPLIVTGSLDCVLRLWNPFITTKPVSLLRGHHASIVKIFLQDQGRRIFSLDKTMLLKVWESSSQTCIQTYSGFAFDSSPANEFSAYYNDRNQLFIVGGFKIASTTCGKLVDELRFDGKTHCNTVSFVFYNRLFKCIITCGMDSNIVIWDPWKNKSKSCIRKAHFSCPMGVQIPLPITAATLDPPHQYLLTGSCDGSIKMWDFNTGLCLRNMDVGRGVEVTKLMWLKNRILAVGENRRVVEFADTMGGKVSTGKSWELRHTNDITAADFRPGQALATGTYNGDLIFWRLETGQSYKRYNVTYPTGLLKLEYLKEKTEKKGEAGSGSNKHSRNSSGGKKETQSPVSERGHLFLKEPQMPVRNLLAEKVIPSVERNLAIRCLLFLKKREMLPDQATLMTATENGMIQAWSHHPSGSFLVAFRAVHIVRDYVTFMETDPDNEFLFTGTLMGYIKIWLMKNYCLTANVEVNVCMPLYRLQFPFLIRDRIRTRVKAALKNQPSPLLLSSHKGHVGAVMHLEYVQECKILWTASADNTVRAWTLSGRYIGCLGQSKPWLNLEWGKDPEKTNAATDFRVPPELVRNASYTTLKVLRGAPPIVIKKYDVEVDLSISEEEKKLGVYGKGLTPPWLGNHHSFPPKLCKKKKLPPVDENMMKIPVFTRLVLSSWKPVPKFPKPQCIQSIKASQNSRSDTESGSTFQVCAASNFRTNNVRESYISSMVKKINLNLQRKSTDEENLETRSGRPWLQRKLHDRRVFRIVLIVTDKNKIVIDSYAASWKTISEKVEQLLNPETKATVTFEPLYSRVYRNVCNGFSEQMHLDLITLCSRHLCGINEKLCPHDENSLEHLLGVCRALKAYLLSVRIISSVFSYLNKFYVTCCLNADLYAQLSSLFSKIVISERISTLMNIVEESLKIPFSVPPEILHHFFNELHKISNGEYSIKYLHLFCRYCPNVLPPMKESDLEIHIKEVEVLKKRQKQCPHLFEERHGVKRPAEDTFSRKVSYHTRQPKTCPIMFE